MSRDRSATDPNYENWPVEGEREPEYVGHIESGGAMFYEPTTKMFYEGDADEANGRFVLREGSGRELDPEETLGEALESIGEKTGWESLSAFADEHLTDDGDGDSS